MHFTLDTTTQKDEDNIMKLCYNDKIKQKIS